MARLEEKVDTDSRRKQRTSDAKSKKVERLKKFVQDLHDDTRLLQQNSDNIHNRISDCMEDEMTAIEEMESEIKQIAVSTNITQQCRQPQKSGDRRFGDGGCIFFLHCSFYFSQNKDYP